MKQTPAYHVANSEILSLVPHDARRVVDVGCMQGAMARELRTRSPLIKVVGLDIDPEYATAAAEHCSEAFSCDIERIAPALWSHLFPSDCWIFGDCLEHLNDPWSLLRRLRDAIDEDGCLLVCLPNAQHWSVQWRLASGQFRYEPSGLLDRTHIRWFTRITLLEMLQDSGWKIESGISRHLPAVQMQEGVLQAIRGMAVAGGFDPEAAVIDALPFQYVFKCVPDRTAREASSETEHETPHGVASKYCAEAEISVYAQSFVAAETSEPLVDLKIAAFTMAYNDPIFLPLWITYYGQQLGKENLFCVDHGSDDGSTENLGISVIRIPRNELDEDQRSTFVSRFQASLLAYYDVVIFSDCDEFLVPDPAGFAGLRDFISQRREPVIAAVGLNVIHAGDTEPGIDIHRPILGQRRYVQYCDWYCKPLICRIPVTWEAGFHSSEHPKKVDQDLFLFHCKAMDSTQFLNDHERHQSVIWSQNARHRGHGATWRLSKDAISKLYNPERLPACPEDTEKAFEFSHDLASGVRHGTVAVIPGRFANCIPGSDRLSSNKKGQTPASDPRPEEETRADLAAMPESLSEYHSHSPGDGVCGHGDLAIDDLGAAGAAERSVARHELQDNRHHV